jgi:hypothetical protein
MNTFANGYALLIGVDENNVPDWSLPAVTQDIQALSQVLTHPERCAYPSDHVKVLTGMNATRQGILDGLDWLKACLQADQSDNETAIIHYSGHGWRDETVQPPAYYLIPYDIRKDNLRSRTLRAEDFAEAVFALHPRRLLVSLDCCHAGGMDIRDVQPSTSFRASAIPPNLLMGGEKSIPASEGSRGLDRLQLGEGRAVMSSSQGDQPSYNRKDGKMGIFTYHLIEALTGHAQPQEGANEVLVSDMMGYVWRRVPESARVDWGKNQQPDYQVSGNFPIAMLLGGKGIRRGDLAPDPLQATPVVEREGTFHVNTNGVDYIGRDKIVHGDEVQGDKVGGDKISVGNVSGTGIAIGRNAQAQLTTGISGEDMEKLFVPIFLALHEAPPEKREEAVQKAEALKEEAAKGKQADDNRMAKLIDGLVGLTPGAVSAVVSAFASPILGGIAGPVTRFVLEKLQIGK